MKLKLKFNIIIIVVMLLGITVSAFLMHTQLQASATAESLAKAELVLETAESVRKYTIDQVRPNLKTVVDDFLPQSVPAYGATEVLDYLRATNPEYRYKEAVLNPTNPRDLADNWEKEIIESYRKSGSTDVKSGLRLEFNTGKLFWLARPIIIKNEACLTCHSVPEAAPKAMIDKYGPDNGFGWQLNEVIGAQIIQVPANIPFQKAAAAFKIFITWLIGIFVVCLVLLNLLMHFVINRRVNMLTGYADSVSRGNVGTSLEMQGQDEIASLAVSIKRMGRSHEKSLQIIQEQAQKLNGKD